MLPLALLGGGLSLGGMGMGLMGSSNAAENMDEVLQRQINTLQGYGRLNQNALNKSIAASSYPSAMQQVKEGKQQFNSAMNPSFMGFQRPMNDNGQALGFAGQTSRNQQMADSRGNMQGFGNFAFQQGIKDLNAGTSMENNNYLARQSMEPFMMRMQEAAHSGDQLAGIGSLLGTTGQLLSLVNMLPGSTSGAAALGAPDAAQMGALNAGYGPVSSGFAASLPTASPIISPEATASFGNMLYGMPW
jgi:hypothetical protein